MQVLWNPYTRWFQPRSAPLQVIQISRYDVLQTYEHMHWNALKTSHWKVNYNTAMQKQTSALKTEGEAGMPQQQWRQRCSACIFLYKHLYSFFYVCNVFITMKKFKVRTVLCHHIIRASMALKGWPSTPSKWGASKGNLWYRKNLVLQRTTHFCHRIIKKEVKLRGCTLCAALL